MQSPRPPPAADMDVKAPARNADTVGARARKEAAVVGGWCGALAAAAGAMEAAGCSSRMTGRSPPGAANASESPAAGIGTLWLRLGERDGGRRGCSCGEAYARNGAASGSGEGEPPTLAERPLPTPSAALEPRMSWKRSCCAAAVCSRDEGCVERGQHSLRVATLQ